MTATKPSKFLRVCNATWWMWSGSSLAIGAGCPVVGVLMFGVAVLVTCVVVKS